MYALGFIVLGVVFVAIAGVVGYYSTRLSIRRQNFVAFLAPTFAVFVAFLAWFAAFISWVLAMFEFWPELSKLGEGLGAAISFWAAGLIVMAVMYKARDLAYG